MASVLLNMTDKSLTFNPTKSPAFQSLLSVFFHYGVWKVVYFITLIILTWLIIITSKIIDCILHCNLNIYKYDMFSRFKRALDQSIKKSSTPISSADGAQRRI